MRDKARDKVSSDVAPCECLFMKKISQNFNFDGKKTKSRKL